MKITYDTELDAISSPDLDAEQTRVLQAQLVSSLAKNESVRDVARKLMAAAQASAALR